MREIADASERGTMNRARMRWRANWLDISIISVAFIVATLWTLLCLR